MGIDLSKVKSALNAFQKTSGNSKSDLWRPEPGKQKIRILPNAYSPDYPFLERLFYYNLGRRTYMSPKSFGDPDPITEYAAKLKRTGEKEDWLEARKLEPKMRTYVPVIVRGQESEGVRWWGFGKTVYEELLGYISDPEYGDITDPQKGRDITLEYLTAEETGKNFPETRLRVSPSQTPLSDDDSQAKGWLTDQPNLDEIYETPSYNELLELFKAGFQNNNDDDEEETSTQSSSSDNDTSKPWEETPSGKLYAPPTKSKSKAAAKVDDVADQFDALLSEVS